jgi:hypothetical protein
MRSERRLRRRRRRRELKSKSSSLIRGVILISAGLSRKPPKPRWIERTDGALEAGTVMVEYQLHL